MLSPNMPAAYLDDCSHRDILCTTAFSKFNANKAASAILIYFLLEDCIRDPKIFNTSSK